MARPSGSRGASRLTAEERSLEKQQAELLRKQKELEKRLTILPVAIEEQQQQRRALAKLRAQAAAPAISPYVGRSGSRGRGKRRQLRTPSRERYLAKLTTLALVVVLALIVWGLWSATSLPHGGH